MIIESQLFNLFSIMLGAVFGSFASVLIYRIPRDFLIWRPSRSTTVCCKKTILWYHNIPIISALWLRFKCAYCDARFDYRYFYLELILAVLFLAVTSVFGFQIVAFKYWAFCFLLIVITFIDLDFRIVPDGLNIVGAIIALLFAITRDVFQPVSLFGEPSIFEALVGGAVGFGIFWVLRFLYFKKSGVEGLGFGDVKLLGMIGLFLGFRGVFYTILISSLTGTLAGIVLMIRNKGSLKTAIPFAPFLAIGAIIYIFSNQYGPL